MAHMIERAEAVLSRIAEPALATGGRRRYLRDMARPATLALLLCDSASADPDGKVTLSGLFDVVWAPRFPAVHAELAVFWKCRFPAAGEAWLVIESPDGRTLVTTRPLRADRQGMAQEINRFPHLELATAGTYWVQLVDAAGPFAETPLEVRALPAAAARG